VGCAATGSSARGAEGAERVGLTTTLEKTTAAKPSVPIAKHHRAIAGAEMERLRSAREGMVGALAALTGAGTMGGATSSNFLSD
jgi:hypothetical protein